MHTCRKWRQIVLASPRDLHLRVFCTYGTPVRKNLDCWPALPIVVQYGGLPALDLPTPEDEDNIMAALRQFDRVVSISLTVTTSFLERLSVIKGEFSRLEDLVLLSQDTGRRPILPSAFWSGPCLAPCRTQLRSLHLTRIAVLKLPRLLDSSRNLVNLQLHEILYPSDFSIEALRNALSVMIQLRSLSLHFLPLRVTSFATSAVTLPSTNRVTLPSLARFAFRGMINPLKDFVAGIDAPHLGDIELTFLREFSDISVLVEFIDRIKMHKSPRRADILSSRHDFTISLMQPEVPACLRLKVSCEPLNVQLSSMAQIYIQFNFSVLLLKVEDLRISATQPLRVMDGPYIDQLVEVVNFIGVKCLRVSGSLSSNIVRALELRDRQRLRQRESVLPALHKLYIPQPEARHASLREAVESFMISRQLSGHPIAVEYEKVLHISGLVCGSGAGTEA